MNSRARDSGLAPAPAPGLPLRGAIWLLETVLATACGDSARAARLSDGRIAVVDAGSGEIRFYDAAGSYLAAVGGEGDGPGEFRDMSLVAAAPGDSLLLYDPRLQRFTWVTAAPAIGRSFPSSD